MTMTQRFSTNGMPAYKTVRTQRRKYLSHVAMDRVNQYNLNEYAFQYDAYRPLPWPPLDVSPRGVSVRAVLLQRGDPPCEQTFIFILEQKRRRF